MSKTPNNLVKRTRVLVKDLIFQEKYSLSDKQTDVMSYIYNAISWALSFNGFMPLTNKKFAQDLPHIGLSSLEKNLKELKDMKLIEVDMIKVPEWNNATVRGIRVTPKGMEYNNHFIKPDESRVIKALQEELEIERIKNQELEELLNSVQTPQTPQTNSVIEKPQSQEEDNILKKEDLENIKKEITEQVIKSIKEIFPHNREPKKEILKEVGEVNIEEDKRKREVDIELIIDEPKNRDIQLEDVVNRDDLDELNRKMEADIIKKEGGKYRDCNFPAFIEAITRDFGLTSAPICNYVGNGDSWDKRTTFYINSYSKLSVSPPEGETYQLKEPEKINNFWKWLYKNQYRVGDIINPTEKPTVQMLNIRYKDENLYTKWGVYKFREVVDCKNGLVKVTAEKDGKIYNIPDRFNRQEYDSNEADRLIFHYLSQFYVYLKS